MGALKNMAGKKVGRLLVLKRIENTKDGKPQYLCKCDCGNYSKTNGKLLRNGHTRSCGCHGREARIKSLTKHSACKTPTYQSWTSMRSRCQNPAYHAFSLYGGRGIVICKRWGDFRNFLSDMGERPSMQHTLDRINPNKGYSPSNCRWADKKTQARNRRCMVHISYQGKSQTLADWADATGLPLTTIKMRYLRGLSPKQILGAPKRTPERVAFGGELITYPELARRVGMSYITLRWRIRKGWSLSEAILP